MARKPDDRAVLHEHPLVTAEPLCGGLGMGMVSGQPVGDDVPEDELDESLEGLAKAQRDSLARRAMVRATGLHARGKVVIAGRDIEALRAEGSQQAAGVDLAGRALEKAGSFCQMQEVILGKDRRSDGEKLREGG